ncbi:MAG: MarR family transcriptional regulator [Phycisphaerae bacterium]|nr:MarR family transcriptional regulator [Phycisphaerae bacterium]
MATRHRGTAAETRALDAYIALMRAAQAVTERVHVPLREHDLTVGQFAVLEAILHKGPLPSGTIARTILISAGNCTTIVDNLETRELVVRERSDVDRRQVTVRLTPEGKKLVTGIFPGHVERLTGEFGRLSVREQEELRRLCKKLGLED